jgi:hypothetical protein
MKLTPEQLHILQHSLGCDKYGQSKSRGRDEHDGCFGFYRNRFVTDAASEDGKICEEIVAAGLMQSHGPQKLAAGMHCYGVTQAGILVMDEQSPEPPKLTRGQQRYREFLRSECGESFGEWLKFKRTTA